MAHTDQHRTEELTNTLIEPLELAKHAAMIDGDEFDEYVETLVAVDQIARELHEERDSALAALALANLRLSTNGLPVVQRQLGPSPWQEVAKE